MPSLKPSVGSASALLRSATSAQNIVTEIQDKAAADAYANSGYTDDAYTTYTDYLTGRHDALVATGSAQNALKAMDIADTIRTATHLNTSAAIARENIGIMAGTATLSDKYNVITDEFVRAQANGDSTLAQSLMAQAYSVNQEIQYQQQQAGDASATLAKANASSDAKVAAQMGDQAIASLKQFNKDFATVGQKAGTQAITKWLNTASDNYGGKTPLQAFADMGVNLPKGAQPNYADIVSGVGKYAYNQYAIAATAAAPYISAGSNNTYEDKANNLVTGATKLPVNGGSMAYGDLAAFSNAINGGYVGYNETTGGFGKVTASTLNSTAVPQGTSFAGFKYDVQSHSVQPVLSNSGFVAASPQLAIEANALGLTTAAKTNKDSLVPGAAAQVTSNSPSWIRNIAPVGSYLNVALNNNGQLQFSATTTTGQPGNAVYTIVKDATGKRAPVESGPTGDIVLGGQYGFDANNIKTTNGTGFMGGNGNTNNGLHGSPHLSLTSDFTSVNTLINQAQQKAAQVSAATLAAAKAMLPTSIPVLPNIVQPTAVPQANISIAPKGVSTAIMPLPVGLQKAANIAPNTANPQKTAGTIQGGTVNLNSGGKIII